MIRLILTSLCFFFLLQCVCVLYLNGERGVDMHYMCCVWNKKQKKKVRYSVL